jgi:hypothetical protein
MAMVQKQITTSNYNLSLLVHWTHTITSGFFLAAINQAVQIAAPALIAGSLGCGLLWFELCLRDHSDREHV